MKIETYRAFHAEPGANVMVGRKDDLGTGSLAAQLPPGGHVTRWSEELVWRDSQRL